MIGDGLVDSLFSSGGLIQLTIYYIGHHSHEGRVIVWAAGPDQFDPQAVGDVFCFDVQVIEHLDMVADKADGRDDNSLIAVRGQVTDRLPDIRFEPGIARPAAAALISEGPARVA